MEKEKSLFKNYGILIFLVIMNVIFTFVTLSDKIKGYRHQKLLIYAIIIGLFSLGVLFIIKVIKKDEDIEKYYLKLLILLGLSYLFIVPLGRVADEHEHFLRSYEISEGHFLSSKNEEGIGGRIFPKELDEVVNKQTTTYSDLKKEMSLKKSNNYKFISFSGSSLYSPLCYIPQTIGIIIGKIFSKSLIIQAYFGRIANFLLCALIMALTMKILPCFKRYFFLLSFMPMTLMELASLSADGLTISLACLFLAYILKLKYSEKYVTKNDVLKLGIISVFLATLKIVYFPLCFLLLLIPTNKFKKKKDKYKVTLGIVLIALIINLGWLKLASNYLIEIQPGVNSWGQIKYILTNPLSYIIILIRTFGVNLEFYLTTMVGMSLEHLDLNLLYLYPFITIILLIYYACYNNDKIEISFNTKIFSGAVLGIVILLIFTSLYVEWTKVANSVVMGVQGRYFIPLLLLVPILCYNKKRKIIDERKSNNFLCYFLVFFNLYALGVIFLSHLW